MPGYNVIHYILSDLANIAKYLLTMFSDLALYLDSSSFNVLVKPLFSIATYVFMILMDVGQHAKYLFKDYCFDIISSNIESLVIMYQKNQENPRLFSSVLKDLFHD